MAEVEQGLQGYGQGLGLARTEGSWQTTTTPGGTAAVLAAAGVPATTMGNNLGIDLELG